MHAQQWIAAIAALVTWGGFSRAMKRYFRFSDQRTLAKSWLIMSAFVCTLVQIVVIATAPQTSLVWTGAGLAVYALANVVFWAALAAHGKSHPAFAFINVAPSQLTTAGPYRFVRHPIYTAYLLAWLAGAAIAAQPWLLSAIVVMGTFYLVAARKEEQAFRASELAFPFIDYQRRTGMFFPKIGFGPRSGTPDSLKRAG